MLIPSNINPLIKEVIESDALFEDFSVQAHSGDGNWIDLIDMKEWVHISLVYREGRVYSKVNANILGFSGVLESHEWCMPNDMLHRSIMQILTVLEHLPREENINDLEWKVHARWMSESRKKRTDIKKQLREEIKEVVKAIAIKDNFTELKALAKYSANKFDYDTILKIGDLDDPESLLDRIVREEYKIRYTDST